MPPTPYGGYNGLTVVVCPSVCPVLDPKSRTEGRSELKFDTKEAHDTGDP